MHIAIKPVRYSEIAEAENFAELIAAYAAECSVPIDPQVKIYAAMEQAGALQCFAAYDGETLIGFASVLSAIMPHNGKRVATIESIFVVPSYRGSIAGNGLLDVCEQHSTETCCTNLLHTVRIGSRLDKVLQHRYGCHPTHTIYTEQL